jgi:hypothetical protein
MGKPMRSFGTIRKRTSGKHQAFYFHNGTYHYAPHTFLTKGDAQAWLTVEEASLLKQTWVAPSSKLTVREVSERWLKSNPTKRERSLERDEGVLRKHILPVLGERTVSQVTNADCHELVNAWVARGHKPWTVDREASVLAALFNYAVSAELIMRSPASKLRLPATSNRKVGELALDDFRRLANALGDNALMMWVGCRPDRRRHRLQGALPGCHHAS